MRWLAVLGLLAVVGYLVVPPIGALLLGSVTDTPPGEAPHFTGASLLEAYGHWDHYRSMALSVAFAACASTLVLVFGGALAWIVARTDSPLRRMADVFTLVPILVPAILFATGWLLLLGPRGGMINLWLMQWLGLKQAPLDLYSFWGMVWVGALQETPLAFLWFWPAFKSMNSDLEDAALMAGASAFMVMRRITVPLLRPAVVSGWIMFFIYALGQLAVPLMIGMPGGVILYSTEIYLAVQRVPSDMNLASALSLALLVASLVGIFVYRRATRDLTRFVSVTGKAFNPRLQRLGRWRPVATGFGILMLCLVALLPMLVLLWNAFIPFSQLPSLAAFKLMSFKNFRAALDYGASIHALVNSLELGAGAGVVTTVLGCLVAWVTLRIKGPAALLALLDQLSTLPIAMPGLIVGVSVLWFYLLVPLPIYGSPWILLIAYVTLHLPYAVRICGSGLSQLHAELEEAGAMCGAPWLTTFRRIVLALLAPSLLTSVIYVGLRSLREYSASILLASPGNEVFSVMALDMWDGGNLNILCAYVTMVTLLMSVLVAFLSWVGRRFGVKVG
jgi:iron(III) transport system permease protein